MFKQKLLTIVGALVALMVTTSVTPANAIYGGTSAAGNPIVVGLLVSQNATSAGCSGALVAPRVVMTASHCLTRPAEGIWISAPGTDLRDITALLIQGVTNAIP